MKKILAIVLSLIFIVALSACGAKDMLNGVTNGENSGINSASDVSGIQNSENSALSQSDAKLTADEAFDIALKDAGLKKTDVSMIENELDYDNGILVYDIDFDLGNHEYSYQINAKTGVIVDRDKDIKD